MVHFPSITSFSVSNRSFIPACIGLGIVAGIAIFIFKQLSSTLGSAQCRTKDLSNKRIKQNSSTQSFSEVFNYRYNSPPDIITGAKLSIMDPFTGTPCCVTLRNDHYIIVYASSHRELIEKVGLRRGMNTANFILIIGGEKRCNGDEDFNGFPSLGTIRCVDRRPSQELLKTLNIYYKDEKPYNQEDVEMIEGCITNGYQRALLGKKCEIQTETLDAYQHYLSNIKTNLQNRAQVEDFSTDYEKEQADSYLDGLIRTIDAIPRLELLPLKEIVREQLNKFTSPSLSPECLNDSSTTIKVKIKTPGNPETECELNRKFLCAHSTLLSGILECRNPNESEPLPLHGIFMDPQLLGFFQSGQLDLKTLSVDQILNVWACADSFGVDYVLKMCWKELFERANPDSLSKEEWPAKEDRRYSRLPECFYELLAVLGITESLPD